MFLLPDSYIEIKKTGKKGRGVFAKKDVRAGTIIGDFLGKIVNDEEADKLEKKYGLYATYFDEYRSIFPNLKQNGVHLINHSCMPNCDVYPYEAHLLFFAARYIFAGEELTISYGIEGPSTAKDTNYPCFCDSLLCNGTMFIAKKNREEIEAFFEKKLNIFAKIIKTNTVLKKLSAYPEHIQDFDFINLYANLDKKPYVLKSHKLPNLEENRKIMRQTGRIIYFYKLQIKIIAVNKLVVISQLTS
ncbi:hypothetical protein A3A74_02860 [Candidatus Roizmanbacteria bacterium RIFCSPLOWO2_01_FULL_35_13]|uniref:SET domain-containing protein n=1 Tax=Candidatus Roizmanbacteria bacterium RIFCSPLOWO2_01_FULL_35_13 TaxID=1802055 RepID=A0A1F7IAX6_9BACT|nr:MAG: hypothetical protein A3A74_02860 [Candidatus Roizmanbacteria bacterium RIFCSPLOWO2_01_FULL_35_13]